MDNQQSGQFPEYIGKRLRSFFTVTDNRNIKTVAGIRHPARICKIRPMLFDIALALVFIPYYCRCLAFWDVWQRTAG